MHISSRFKWRIVFPLLVLFISSVAFGGATSQSALAKPSSAVPEKFVSFSIFLKNVSNARYQDYAFQSGIAVQSEQAFAEMRSYILDLYSGVTQVNSYVLDGQYFDCITVNSQPTVNHLHIKQIAKPPQVSTVMTFGKDQTHGSARAINSLLTPGQKDAFGNPIACNDGTIPMERITLERMVQFPTLRAFLAKGPVEQETTCGGGPPHRYAVGKQSVNNYGGNSWLNLWNPKGGFSLSQQWYAGGTGSSLQTVEGGWVHYPAHFGSQSVLFIFYTPDGYCTGCYNLECSGFVQINNNWYLGKPFDHYSTKGGTQWGFMMQWKYYQGNWWLFLQGSGNFDAVGYYPGSIYKHGQLASNAQLVQYGGETSTSGSNWPQMGSGGFANAGFQQAAFQKTIFYISKNGGTSVWTTLTPVQKTPKCYTIIITPSTSGGSWGTYFYFGGPGGYC